MEGNEGFAGKKTLFKIWLVTRSAVKAEGVEVPSSLFLFLFTLTAGTIFDATFRPIIHHGP